MKLAGQAFFQYLYWYSSALATTHTTPFLTQIECGSYLFLLRNLIAITTPRGTRRIPRAFNEPDPVRDLEP